MMLGYNELLLCLVFRMQAAVAFYSVTAPWLPLFWAAMGNFLPVEWFGGEVCLRLSHLFMFSFC